MAEMSDELRRGHEEVNKASPDGSFCGKCLDDDFDPEWPCLFERAAAHIDKLETEATLRECTVKLAEWIVDDANAKAEIDRRTDVEGWPHD